MISTFFGRVRLIVLVSENLRTDNDSKDTTNGQLCNDPEVIARTMIVTAILHTMIAVIAFIAGFERILLITVIFVAIWRLSVRLFAKSSLAEDPD